MTRPIHHKLDIYGTELHAAYDRHGWSLLRRANPDLGKPSDLGWGQTTDSRHKTTDVQHLWLWVDLQRHDGDKADLIDTMAHEATHGVEFILGYRGIASDSANGEPFAYLVGWLTAWLWRNQP